MSSDTSLVYMQFNNWLTSQQGRTTIFFLTTPPLKPLIPTLFNPSPTWVMAPPSLMQHYRMSFGNLGEQSGELGGDLKQSGLLPTAQATCVETTDPTS